MPYTPLKISIPTPCHEDWNGMHAVPGASARHCDSCAKNVTDFTGMTDAQMNAYIRESGGKLCGRFRPDQLGRPLRAASSPSRSNPLKVAATAAGLMFASAVVEGQQVEKPVPPKPAIEIEAQITGEIAIYDPVTLNDTVPSPVIPQPPVLGRIAIPQPPPVDTVPEPGDEDWLVGDIEYVEEDTTEIVTVPRTLIQGKGTCTPSVVVDNPASPPPIISSKPAEPAGDLDSIPFNIDLPKEPMEGMLMGMIAIHDFPEPTGMDWFRDSIKSLLVPTVPSEELPQHPRPRPNELPPYLENLTVSPNPFVDHLLIELDLPEKQALTVELLDPNGRLVHAEIWKAQAGKGSFKILPKQRKMMHAIYYLRVTDVQGRTVVKTVVR